MRESTGRKVFNIFNIILMLILIIVTVYPLLNQVALSFSSSSAILNGKVTLIPVDFTIDTYTTIAKESTFWVNYKNTLVYTITGTLLSLIMVTLCSYPLSKKYLVGRGPILNFIVFTMFFGGGLIPNFVLIKNLGMIDTIWAVILPQAIIPYHVLLMKTYFQGLPEDLEDASKIDGLSQFGYFSKIALPLSKPIIATITLFVSVLHWNDWFTALLYLNKSEKFPVTLYLRNIMAGATMAAQTGETIDSTVKSVPQSTQATALILVVLPILCVYPFVQKYFVKGVMIGSIKG